MAIDVGKLPLSEKQITHICESNRFVNLAEGAIQSGKTAFGLLRWLMFIADPKTPSTGDLLVTAKTYDTAVRNFFNPLRDPALFGPAGQGHQLNPGRAESDDPGPAG